MTNRETSAPVSLVPRWPLLSLIVGFCAMTFATWASWGSIRVDTGTSIYRVTRLSEGAILYHDIHSPYGPVADYVMAFFFALFGAHLTVAYLVGLALLACQSVVIWKIGRQFLSEAETTAALLLFFVVFGFDPGLFNWPLPNTFASPFAVLFSSVAALCMVEYAKRTTTRALVLASLATGLAGMSKIEFGVAAYGTIVLTLFALRAKDCGRAKYRGLAKDWAAATLPGGLVALLILGAVLASGVGFEELIFDNLYRVRSMGPAVEAYRNKVLQPVLPILGRAALFYIIELPLRVLLLDAAIRRVRGFSPTSVVAIGVAMFALLVPFVPDYPINFDLVRPVTRQVQFGWATTVWAIVLIASWVRLRRDASAPALFIVAAYSLLVTLRWSFHVAWPPYYATFAPLLVPLSLRFITKAVLGRVPEKCIAAIVVVCALVAALHGQQVVARHTGGLDYPRGFIAAPGLGALPVAQVIDHLREQSAPEDFVAVVPEEHFINFFAERRHPSRDPGVGPGWLANPEDVREYLAELESHETRFIVLSARRYTELGSGAVPSYLPELIAYIEQNYDEDLSVHGFKVYRRRDGTTGH